MPYGETLPLLVACSMAAYAAGSVNLSVVGAKVVGVDGLRRVGSGNPGVTNLFRAAGAGVAVAVLVLEIGKAVAAVNLVLIFGAASLKPLLIIPYLLGNLFPVFHRFKGGKGVAAAVGAMLAASPVVMLLGGCVFLVVFALFRRVSLGSLSMAFSYPIWGLGLGESPLLIGISAAVAVVLAITHRENIIRLVEGTEPRLKGKS